VIGGLVELFTADRAVAILIQPLKQFVAPFFGRNGKLFRA
jgi:hypothetical protein